MGCSTPVRSVTPTAQAGQPIVNPVASRAATPAASPVNARPTYQNPCIQALSDQGACFSCSQKDHFVKNCPIVAKINEVSSDQKDNTESEKEEP